MFQTCQAATAIITYNSDHTGPNTHDGGFHDGLSRPAYHCPGMKRLLHHETSTTRARKANRETQRFKSISLEFVSCVPMSLLRRVNMQSTSQGDNVLLGREALYA